ncbi:MAG: lipid-A-disaccharide synthase [Gammaproteobacteria bacterium]|nr:lipid-A-disaccharide synthase [Gammaproteobacteria bacterium]
MADGPLIALVAGEASGDNLGAALIEALRARLPNARFVAIAGPRMRAAGCEVLASSDELAVMGLAEIVRHLRRLWSLRSRVTRDLLARRPDVFIGIDAPEFNLGLARRLKAAGVRTVQYVSPQVWAWRQSRVHDIARACDRILCLLPFEPAFYAAHGVEARFVGHPLADQFPLQPDRAAARAALGLAADAEVIAVLPGSRIGEVSRLALPFAAAARWLFERRADVRFVAPMTTAATRVSFEAAWRAAAPAVPVQIEDGKSRAVLAAADVVLVASGTATLETLLTQRPMVVAYKLAPVTAFLLRRLGLVKVAHFAQANLLVGRRAVPEFFQADVRADALGGALLHWLTAARAPTDSPQAQELARLRAEFAAVHAQLRCNGAALAAAAVVELLGESR